MRRAAAGRLSLIVWLTLGPSLARAEVTLAAPSCEGLDLAALRTLVELEIGDVAAEWSAISEPVVLLGCAQDSVRIEITDPVTDKSVARTIAMPSLDRERVLAIAVAQLFLTSWLEILLDEGSSRGPGSEAAERHVRAIVRAAREDEDASADEPVTPLPPDEPEERSPSLRLEGELGLEGGARVRPDGGLVTALGGLRAIVVIDGGPFVGLRSAIEWGRAERERGTIHVIAGGLGITAGWRTPELGPLSADLSATVSLVALVYEGHPGRPFVIGGTTSAIVGEAALELAPTLRAGPFRFALPLSASGIAFAPQGEVTGEPPVVAGGLVLSASLRVSATTSF